MKKLTYYILPRYMWFRIYYKQWFKNLNGIKAFAHQCMNWLMKEVLKLAAVLKHENKKLTEDIKTLKNKLANSYKHPFVQADEFASIKSKLRTYTFLIYCAILGEFFFNFFAAKSLLSFAGWIALLGQVLLSAFFTWGFFKIFENLFVQLFNEPLYKTNVRPRRHWLKFLFLLAIAIAYEIGVYYLCQVRGITIEGNGNGVISHTLMIFGMLFPIVAGYYGYEKNIYKSAYHNTLTINKTERAIAVKENKIKTNDERMKIHFNQQCQSWWAYLQEFRTYKEVYDHRREIPMEDLHEYFCESFESFLKEAVERYGKESINQEAVQPTIIITPAQGNGTHSLTNQKTNP